MRPVRSGASRSIYGTPASRAECGQIRTFAARSSSRGRQIVVAQSLVQFPQGSPVAFVARRVAPLPRRSRASRTACARARSRKSTPVESTRKSLRHDVQVRWPRVAGTEMERRNGVHGMQFGTRLVVGRLASLIASRRAGMGAVSDALAPPRDGSCHLASSERGKARTPAPHLRACGTGSRRLAWGLWTRTVGKSQP